MNITKNNKLPAGELVYLPASTCFMPDGNPAGMRTTQSPKIAVLLSYANSDWPVYDLCRVLIDGSVCWVERKYISVINEQDKETLNVSNVD